jgi:hypothetical protein
MGSVSCIKKKLNGQCWAKIAINQAHPLSQEKGGSKIDIFRRRIKGRCYIWTSASAYTWGARKIAMTPSELDPKLYGSMWYTEYCARNMTWGAWDGIWDQLIPSISIDRSVGWAPCAIRLLKQPDTV